MDYLRVKLGAMQGMVETCVQVACRPTAAFCSGVVVR